MTKKTIYSLLIFSTIACQSTVFADKTQDFFNAVENNKLEEVKKLAPEIEDINATNKDGLAAIHIACEKGHLKIVKHLTSIKHIDLNKKDQTNDRTPLWLALYYEKYEIAKIILEKSKDQNFNIPDKEDNMTPLWLALYRKQYEIAEMIIEKSTNQNFNIPNKTNKATPLFLSINNENFTMIKILIENGAKVDTKSIELANKKYRHIKSIKIVNEKKDIKFSDDLELKYLKMIKTFDNIDSHQKKINFIKNKINKIIENRKRNLCKGTMCIKLERPLRNIIKVIFARSIIEILENNKSYKSTIFYKLLQISKADKNIKGAIFYTFHSLVTITHYKSLNHNSSQREYACAILNTFNEKKINLINNLEPNYNNAESISIKLHKKLYKNNNYIDLLQFCINEINLLTAKTKHNQEKLKKLDKQNKLFNNNNFKDLIIKTVE